MGLIFSVCAVLAWIMGDGPCLVGTSRLLRLAWGIRDFPDRATILPYHYWFASKEVDLKNIEKRYACQINFTQALSKMKDPIVLLFDRSKKVVRHLLESLLSLFIDTVEPIRPNRKFPKTKKVQRKGLYANYKPIH